ncbi:MAG: response regulator [Anaerotruncus sp.]|nr:response regulator [Anaerotruncus sp.]
METAINGLDGAAKLRNVLPDAVILDYHLSRKTCKELLEEKARNPNTAGIPVILTAQKIDKNRLLELVAFNIKKVFMKPIKIDALYQTLSEILGVPFEIDTTPCVIEAHVNDAILFIEIAQGMNREKIELLRVQDRGTPGTLRDLPSPGPHHDLGHGALLRGRPQPGSPPGNRALGIPCRNRHLKILTRSSFVRAFVQGRSGYADIEVVDDLRKAMDGLLADAGSGDSGAARGEIISERILSADRRESSSGIRGDARFEVEAAKPCPSRPCGRRAGSGYRRRGRRLRDPGTHQDNLPGPSPAKVTSVLRRAFLPGSPAGGGSHDLVFLDILMPGMNGYEVLDALRVDGVEVPVIILSALGQKEAVLKAFQRGVKSHLIKPLKPEQILRKTLEILKANFLTWRKVCANLGRKPCFGRPSSNTPLQRC